MAYCTKDEVASDFKDIKFETTGTSILAAEVTAWCEEASEFIDGYVSTLYSTPVEVGVSPKSFKVLRMLCIYLVADRVRHVLYTRTGNSNQDQDTKGLYSLSRNPRKDLKDIQDGTLKLTDAIAASSDIGFDTGDVECCEPMFSKCKTQW